MAQVIRYGDSLIEARLVRRYKRFLADVELAGGEVVTAHCANPGSMKTCMVEGGRVWLSRSNDPRRKLAYSWELACVAGQMVVVNTARGNQLVAAALERRHIAELAEYDSVRREVRVGDKSRIDFLLEGVRPTYVEVKSVTMAADEPGAAQFPDSVSARGTRHLEELMTLRSAGSRAVLLFCVARSGVRAVRPADAIDPVYGQTLRKAAAAGVEILAYASVIGPRAIAMRQRIPVEL